MKKGLVICDNQKTLILYNLPRNYMSSTCNEFIICPIIPYRLDKENDYDILYVGINGIIQFGEDYYKWYFKATFDTSIIMFGIIKSRMGKDVARLISKAIWNTRNELIWL